MELRPYQEKTINRVKQFINEPKQELIIKLHTGLGKTFLMPRIAKELNQQGYSVLVLSDIMQLIYQLEEHFQDMQLEVSRIVSETKTNILSDITLASEQTLCNRLKRVNKREKLIILYDEAHKRRFGDRFQAIIEYLEPTKLLGFSATPFDMNGVLLFDNIYEPITYREAIEQGYLTPIKYYIPKVVESINFDSIDKGSNLDYSAKDIAKLYDTKEFAEWFKKFYYENQCDKKQTLIFTGSIEQAEMVHKWIGSDVCELVHSKRKQEENQKCINDFKQGKIKTLISVTSLTTGFDAPNVTDIINLRPTKSIPLFFQIAGRGSRIHNSKNQCNFYDITDTLIRFGLPEQFKPFKTKEEAKQWLANQTLIESYLKHKKEDIVEVTEEKLEKFEIELEELENQPLHLLTLEQLRDIYWSTNNVRKMVLVLNELWRRYRGFQYRSKTLEWIITEINNYLVLMENYNKGRSFLKAIKTRGANLFKKRKKLPALGHFASWFYEQQIRKYLLENLNF